MMTRRGVLVAASAAGLVRVSWVSRTLLRNEETQRIVRVRFVSACSAPCLVKEPWPTRPLTLIWKQDLPYVALGENLLGRLPRSAFGQLSAGASSETKAALRVQRVRRNEHGRLEIF